MVIIFPEDAAVDGDDQEDPYQPKAAKKVDKGVVRPQQIGEGSQLRVIFHGKIFQCRRTEPYPEKVGGEMVDHDLFPKYQSPGIVPIQTENAIGSHHLVNGARIVIIVVESDNIEIGNQVYKKDNKTNQHGHHYLPEEFISRRQEKEKIEC